jgi:hypothetical protein
MARDGVFFRVNLPPTVQAQVRLLSAVVTDAVADRWHGLGSRRQSGRDFSNEGLVNVE